MAMAEEMKTGELARISGSMIAADGMLGVAMVEILRVGRQGLIAEVIRIDGLAR